MLNFKIYGSRKKLIKNNPRTCFKFQSGDTIKIVRGKFKGTIDNVYKIVGDYIFASSLFKISRKDSKKKMFPRIHVSNIMHYDKKSDRTSKKIFKDSDGNWVYFSTNNIAREKYISRKTIKRESEQSKESLKNIEEENTGDNNSDSINETNIDNKDNAN